MSKLTESQELAINSLRQYTLDFRNRTESIEDLELIADATIMNQTQAKSYVDLGGITVYFKDSKLVAFYDYEMQCGTVFDEAVA